MTDQLDLTGEAHTIVAGRELTHRQQIALDLIREKAPVESDEIGALLHEERAGRGKRGHTQDVRCEWCGQEGDHMAARLRELGLIRHARNIGWYPADQPRPRARDDGRPGPGDLPEDF